MKLIINSKNSLWFIVSLIVILSDQASKYWMLQHFSPYEHIALCPMVNFVLAFNTGAAFSFLHNAGAWHTWFFIIFNFLMSIVLIAWILRLPKTESMQLLALSLILGGAIGNLCDRLSLGHVIDFIDVYYKTYHWPAFNIADSAICAGAVLLFIGMYRKSK